MSRSRITCGSVLTLLIVCCCAEVNGLPSAVTSEALTAAGWVTGPNSGGKQYFCSKGSFQPKESLDSFAVGFRECARAIGTEFLNEGGMPIMTQYSLWKVILELKPPLIVESGIWNGVTSCMVRHAVDTYGGAVTVRLDPQDRAGRWRDPSHNSFDWVGKDFHDFNRIDWASKFDRSLRENALVVFDDHMNQIERMLEAKEFGFRHLYFDDNYAPGTGDAFSLQDACDGPAILPNGGKVRAVNSPTKRVICTDFGLCCRRATNDDYMDMFQALIDNIEVYWEPPPFMPLSAAASLKYKQPVYTEHEAVQILGLSVEEARRDGRFGPQAYVRLKHSIYDYRMRVRRSRLGSRSMGRW